MLKLLTIFFFNKKLIEWHDNKYNLCHFSNIINTIHIACANFSFIHSNLRFTCFLINIMHLKFKSKINILGLCFIIYIKHQRFHVSIIILKAFFSIYSFFISIYYPYFCNLPLKILSWMKHINILYRTYITQYITNNFFFF